MSVSEKPSSSERDLDPLLKDLSEKKQSFRRHVVSLATELKDVRSRLASQEESFARETLTRQACNKLEKLSSFCSFLEPYVSVGPHLDPLWIRSKWFKDLTGGRDEGQEHGGEDISIAAKFGREKRPASGVRLYCEADELENHEYRLDGVDIQDDGSYVISFPLYPLALDCDSYLKELDDLRLQLSATQATADTSAVSAQAAQLQCLALLKELDEKNSLIKEHEDRVNRLGEQLDHLQKDLQAREASQKQLKDEILRIEQDIMQVIAKAGASKDSELRKILDEISPKNFDMINKLLNVKDEEIAKLRDEIRIMSARWKLKTKDLESQVEKHWRADHELKKRVLQLEFCLQHGKETLES
ncbi:hypothetical protein HHK36_019666 [Tetracentron sinense]|uniref:Uncharacterized protein n=1 Tax=Tetracentron sinense TaxID=13715 RepID=A0A835DA90_TETSI|nr:hypothetical protein HHK36_019666 [Tetracentron sinense]